MIQAIRHIRRAIAVVCLLLVGLYYVNVTMFWHSHIINGVTVAHSHIHQQQHHATESGGHTAPQLLLIQLLHDALICTGAALAISLIIPLLSKIHNNGWLVQACRLGYNHFSSLRAPPCCVIF